MCSSVRRVSFLLFVLLLAPQAARAIGTLDQQFVGAVSPSTVPIHGSLDAAQSITISLRGELGSLELAIGKSPTTADAAELLIEIRPADASGVPDDDDDHVFTSFTVFGSDLSIAPSTSALYEIDFSARRLGFDAGQKIAVVLRSNVAPGDAFLWAGDLAGGYAGGAAYERSVGWQVSASAADVGFRVFIVPEPQGAAEAALLALAAIARLRRRA